MDAPGLGGKVKKAPVPVFFKKIVKIFIIGNVQQMPVIKPCAFQLFVVNVKAHRLNKVEPCARCGAGARNVSGVLGNLRLNKDNIKRSHFCHIFSIYQLKILFTYYIS